MGNDFINTNHGPEKASDKRYKLRSKKLEKRL